jgi:putative tryptophan/tyrosine transport system substrate-binding protein
MTGALAFLSTGGLAWAQSSKLARVGALIHGAVATPEQLARSPLRQGLRELGWVVGQNMTIEALYSEGHADRLAELAKELVRRRVDVIWCNGPPSTLAAARATTTIPIVFWGVALPVEQGLVASVGRPGGNVTGFAFSAGAEFATKLLELLRAFAPNAIRIALISGLSAIETLRGERVAFPVVESAFRQFGMERRRFLFEARETVPRVLSSIVEWNPDAMFVFGDPATWLERQRIAEFALRHRLPSVFGMKDFAIAGGLFSYGANAADTIRRSAYYIDKILKGAKSADLPVEQPTMFELVINAKTARALGLTIPPSLLVRADQVIEQ